MTLDIHDITRRLIQNLGNTLATVISGSSTRTDPPSWADKGTPNEEQERRLRAAWECWTAVQSREGDDVARAWFIGSNPGIDDTPIMHLRKGYIDETIMAAREGI